MPVWVGIGVVTPLVARVVVGLVVDDLVDVVEDCVEVMGDCVDVAEDCVEVMGDWLDVVDVVTGTSSVTSPITQYSLLTSRAGQMIPGFNLMRSLTGIAQLSARLAHVVPLSTGVR
jgi:hypothetical protein